MINVDATPLPTGDLGAWLVDIVEGEVAAAVDRLGDLTVSGRVVVVALTDWLDRMVASGVAQRAVAAALAASLARRGIRLAYQTFRNYRCQTSRLLGAGVRERVALVDGVDHGHLRAAPGALGRDEKGPVAAAAIERALARSGVCGEPPAPDMLGRVLDRLKPVRAVASSRLSVLARVARQGVTEAVRKLVPPNARRMAVAVGDVSPASSGAVSAPGGAPSYMEGWRPAPPLKPVPLRIPSSVEAINLRGKQEEDERRARERAILLRRETTTSPDGSSSGADGERR